MCGGMIEDINAFERKCSWQQQEVFPVLLIS